MARTSKDQSPISSSSTILNFWHQSPDTKAIANCTSSIFLKCYSNVQSPPSSGRILRWKILKSCLSSVRKNSTPNKNNLIIILMSKPQILQKVKWKQLKRILEIISSMRISLNHINLSCLKIRTMMIKELRQVQTTQISLIYYLILGLGLILHEAPSSTIKMNSFGLPGRKCSNSL